MSEEIKDEARGDEPAPNPLPRAIGDILIALGLTYATVVIFQVVLDWPDVSIGKSTFFFFFLPIFPLLAPFFDITHAIFLTAFVGLFWAIFKYAPTPYRIFALAIAMVGWEAYGGPCSVLVTGGA